MRLLLLLLLASPSMAIEIGPSPIAQTATIADASVTTAKLADGSVTTVKLADAAVTSAKLANTLTSSMTFTSDILTKGKLWVNNAAPFSTYQFSVDGSNSDSVNIFGISGGSMTINATNDGAAAYRPLVIDAASLALNTGSGGNVGIGTASPVGQLHVTQKASSGAGDVRFDSADNAGVLIRVASATTGNFYIDTRAGNFSISPEAGTGIQIDGAAQPLIHLGTPGGTQLFYCNGGTFAGNVGRGGSTICTGGSAVGLGIFVP